MRKQLVEFIGTFFLVLTVWLAVKFAGTLAPLAIWSVLMVMVYAWGHLSWWHYNPAVTLWLIVRGKISTSDAIWYVVAQIVWWILAALVVSYLVWTVWNGAVAWDWLQIVVSEILFTFGLVYVVCWTATSKWSAGNSFYGLAIWFTVMVGAFVVGSISGGAFNPAVAIAGIFDWTFSESNVLFNIWWEIIGAVLAAYTYNYVDFTENE